MNPILWPTRPHVPDHHANTSTSGLRNTPVQTTPDTYSNFSSSPEDQPSLGGSEESFNSTPSLDLYALSQYTPPDEIRSLEDGHNSPVLSSNLHPDVSLLPRPPMHNEPNPTYHCPQCEKVFDKPFLRNKHYSRKHSRRYPCEVLGCQQASFALKADLVRHRNSLHRELFRSRSFPCTFPSCPYALNPFSRKDHLMRHLQKKHN